MSLVRFMEPLAARCRNRCRHSMSVVLGDVLGLDKESLDLTLSQVCMRGLVVFGAGLILVRVAHKRFFAKRTAFDFLLTLLLGSMLGRVVNGPEPLFATIAASFLLVILHRCLSWAAMRSKAVGNVVKGHTDVLVEDGRIATATLTAHRITMADLHEEMHLQANLTDLGDVAFAYLERNGEISFVKTRKGEGTQS